MCSYNFFGGFFRGLSGLYKKRNAKGLDRSMPILLLSGADDPVGGDKGTERLYRFYRKQGMRDVSRVIIEGGRHEFLNEPEHFDEAVSAVAAFLKRVPARAR